MIPSPGSLARELETQCRECGRCAQWCPLLKARGLPGPLAGQYNSAPGAVTDMAFDCSLCGLCTRVCPQGLSPMEFFQTLRDRTGQGPMQPTPAQRRRLFHERVGRSSLLAWHGLPPGCRTVFFPGCALAGFRPHTVMALFHRLRSRLPDMGLVLDCCASPSRSLGRIRAFERIFDHLIQSLTRQGVTRILTACPNCHRVFKEAAPRLQVDTVFEILAQSTLPAPVYPGPRVTLHDPCVLREEPGIHQAVRTLVRKMGLDLQEMNPHGPDTLCCGQGGGGIPLPLSAAWTGHVRDQAHGLPILTYCAGCTQALSTTGPTLHLLDLFTGTPPSAPTPTATGSRPYLRRLGLKARLMAKPSPRHKTAVTPE